MTTKTAKTKELTVWGNVGFSIDLKLPTSKTAIAKLAQEHGLDPDVTIEEIAVQLVNQALETTINRLKHKTGVPYMDSDLEIENDYDYDQ